MLVSVAFIKRICIRMRPGIISFHLFHSLSLAPLALFLFVLAPWAGRGAVLPAPDFAVFRYLAFGSFWQKLRGPQGAPPGLAKYHE